MKKLLKTTLYHPQHTLAADAGDISKDLMVALELKGKKPGIIINLSAAERSKARVSSQILKLARVVR